MEPTTTFEPTTTTEEPTTTTEEPTTTTTEEPTTTTEEPTTSTTEEPTTTTEEPTTSTTEEPTTTTEEPTTSTTEEPTTSTTEEPTTTTTSTTVAPTTSTTEEPTTSTTEEPTTTTTTVAPTTTTTTTTPIPDCEEQQRLIRESIDKIQEEIDNIKGRILVAQANLNEKNQEFLPILNRVNVYQIVPAETDHPNFERDFGIANGVIDRRIDKLKTEATDAAGKVTTYFNSEPRRSTPEYQAALIADMRYKEYVSRKCGNTQELLNARSTYDQTVSNYNTLKALYESQINTARIEQTNKEAEYKAEKAKLRDCTENPGTKGACGSDGKDFIADENGKPILFCCNFGYLAELRKKTA